MHTKIWKIIISIIIAAIIWLLMGNFAGQQRMVAAIFAFTVVLWATEAFPIGITALVGMSLLVLLADVNEKTAFSGLGDPIIPMFICGLILAKAMEVTGLGKRFALSILSKPWANRSPARLLLIIIIITATISLLLSNTATTAMMFPIGVSILTTLGIYDKKYPFAIAVLLSLSFAASVSVGTPIGTPPDLMAVGDLYSLIGKEIGFLQWVAFGLPITIIMVLVTWKILMWMFGKQALDTSSNQQAIIEQKQSLGNMSHAELTTLTVLLLALFLWILPDLAGYTLKNAFPQVVAWLNSRLTAQITAIIAVLSLFLFPVKGTESGTSITWKQAAGIDWGVILLFGGGVSLGNVLFDCGLAKELGNTLAHALGANTLWSVTALGIGTGIFISEFSSNTSAAAMLLPMIIGLAQGVGVSPVAPAIGTALGVSMGFALPFSTPTNAIVYSSGIISQKQMLIAGLLIDFVGFFVILGCLRLILPLVGLV
jgi:solute carrier family 13 (sodium-dependent dicarboxylate transporter), member 2/3/5